MRKLKGRLTLGDKEAKVINYLQCNGGILHEGITYVVRTRRL